MLLAGGAPGKRLALPNARVLIHQPHGGAQGQSIDIENQAREIAFLRGRLEEILALHTGQPRERIAADTDRDYILGAEDAVDYGLVDEVLQPRRLKVVRACPRSWPPAWAAAPAAPAPAPRSRTGATPAGRLAGARRLPPPPSRAEARQGRPVGLCRRGRERPGTARGYGRRL